MYTTILFFGKSKHFLRFFVYEVLASAFLLPLNAVWVAVTISMATGTDVVTIFQSIIEQSKVEQTIAGAFWGSIWILYLYRSKRVANTFVN